MKILMWILQVVLALFFANAGWGKVSTPVNELAKMMGWIDAFPGWFVPVLGGLEIAAAIGLILPAAFGIAEILTPLAAVGLTLVMVGATITHLTRGETQMLTTTIPAAAIAAFVAWGRFRLLSAGRTAEAEAVPAQ